MLKVMRDNPSVLFVVASGNDGVNFDDKSAKRSGNYDPAVFLAANAKEYRRSSRRA